MFFIFGTNILYDDECSTDYNKEEKYWICKKTHNTIIEQIQNKELKWEKGKTKTKKKLSIQMKTIPIKETIAKKVTTKSSMSYRVIENNSNSWSSNTIAC